MTYQIIAHYSETGEVITACISASDPHAAMTQYAITKRHAWNLDIICAIPLPEEVSDLEIICPCEDAGKSCDVQDLLFDPEEENEEV